MSIKSQHFRFTKRMCPFLVEKILQIYSILQSNFATAQQRGTISGWIEVWFCINDQSKQLRDKVLCAFDKVFLGMTKKTMLWYGTDDMNTLKDFSQIVDAQ